MLKKSPLYQTVVCGPSFVRVRVVTGVSLVNIYSILIAVSARGGGV